VNDSYGKEEEGSNSKTGYKSPPMGALKQRLKARSPSATMMPLRDPACDGGGGDGRPYGEPYRDESEPDWWYDAAELDADGGESAKRHLMLLPGMICMSEPDSTCRTSMNVGSNAST